LFGAITRVGRCTCSINQADGGRLAGAGGTQQHHVLLACRDPAGQVGDRLGLIAAGLEVRDHPEGGDGTLQIGGGPHD
jgi:hypothetical protein